LQANFFVGPTYGAIAAQHYLEAAGNPNETDYNYVDLLVQLASDYDYVCPTLAFAR